MSRLDDLRAKAASRELDNHNSDAFLEALSFSLDRMEAAALRRLDVMVEAGNRRQAYRMFSWQLQQRAEFRTLFGSVYRTPDDQARLYAEWKLRGGVGAVAGSSLHERHLALDFYAPYMIQGNKIVLPETP